jgi:hypothetical protein
MATIFLNCKNLASNGSIAGVGGMDSVTGTQKHFTEAEAIAAIDSASIRFVDRDNAGHHTEVRVSHHGQHRFLETHRDGVKTDNLECLPICHHVPVQPSPTPVPLPYRPAPVHRGHCVYTKKLG